MNEPARKPGCRCHREIGDSPCPIHDCHGDDAPPHVREWAEFLETVEIKGPIPIRFRLHQDRDSRWLLESKMLVPARDSSHPCEFCHRIYRDNWITFENWLLPATDRVSKAEIIQKRVVGMFMHEALESVFVGGHRAFDPHDGRWYSNLVADWRFNV